MSSPTDRYRQMPGLTPEHAAEWMVTAIRTRPVRMIPRYTALLRIIGMFNPRAVDRILMRWG